MIWLDKVKNASLQLAQFEYMGRITTNNKKIQIPHWIWPLDIRKATTWTLSTPWQNHKYLQKKTPHNPALDFGPWVLDIKKSNNMTLEHELWAHHEKVTNIYKKKICSTTSSTWLDFYQMRKSKWFTIQPRTKSKPFTRKTHIITILTLLQAHDRLQDHTTTFENI
jgi:hypothetical protein